MGLDLSYLGDVVQGFTGGMNSIRAERTRQAELQAARDEKIFTALANSDDPDIRAAAVTGLLSGNPPARGLDKWFGTTSTHPGYEQIKTLIGQGKQPFMDPAAREEKVTAARTRGSEYGRVSGAANAYNDIAGEWPSQDMTERMVMGSMNVGRGSSAGDRRGVADVVDDDGTVRKGVAVVSRNGVLYEQQGDQLIPVQGSISNWRTNAPSPSTAGVRPVNRETTVEHYISMYGPHDALKNLKPTDTIVYRADSATNKPMPDSFPVLKPAGPPSFSPVVTDRGISAFNNRSGAVGPASGGANVGARLPANTNVEYLQREVRRIMEQAEKELQPRISGGLKPSGQQIRARADEIAKRSGHGSLAELEAKIGPAGQGIESATPGAPPQVEPSAGPPAAPGKQPPKKQPGTSDEIFNAVMKRLGIGPKQ